MFGANILCPGSTYGIHTIGLINGYYSSSNCSTNDTSRLCVRLVNRINIIGKGTGKMIQLTLDQVKQLHSNLSAIANDLEEIINADEETTFLNVGGKAGMALQKVYDATAFSFDLMIKAEQSAPKSSPPLGMSPEEEEALHTLRTFNRIHYS